MKKVIDGRRYDTDKAERICGYAFSNRNDFNFIEEDLFRSPKGQLFIAGTGGPMSKYRKNVGNGHVSGGSDIRLVTESEAKEWIEIHQDRIEKEADEVIEKLFGIEEG
ncbi:MAG: hypothetical protein ACLFUH_01790 [Bacteroidales bacterium]